jgi:hypothetical protein
MNTKQIEALLDSALEHFAHGWVDLEKNNKIEYTIPDAFPPHVNAPVGSAVYHFAAVVSNLKRAYDLVRAEEEHVDMVMEKVNKALGQ